VLSLDYYLTKHFLLEFLIFYVLFSPQCRIFCLPPWSSVPLKSWILSPLMPSSTSFSSQEIKQSDTEIKHRKQCLLNTILSLVDRLLFIFHKLSLSINGYNNIIITGEKRGTALILPSTTLIAYLSIEYTHSAKNNCWIGVENKIFFVECAYWSLTTCILQHCCIKYNRCYWN